MSFSARVSAAKEILWGYVWFRIAFIVWGIVSTYDTFSGAISQIIPGYELMPLGELVMGSSHLLPWWGWLLVLQGLLWLSLVEYVTRHAPKPLAASSNFPNVQQRNHAALAQALLAANRLTITKSQWSRAKSLQLYQVASLWVGEFPPVSHLLPSSQATQASLARLIAAVISGDLRAEPSKDPFAKLKAYEDSIGPETRVTRENLIDYAKAEGEEPEFLFPKI